MLVSLFMKESGDEIDGSIIEGRVIAGKQRDCASKLVAASYIMQTYDCLRLIVSCGGPLYTYAQALL